MQETIEFLDLLANEAGAIARTWFRKTPSVETKGDDSPVTIADRTIEERLRALIEKHCPDDGIQGEEFGTKTGRSGRVWVIDPIDGTRAFTIGRATFATLVGVCDAGRAVAGLIDQPVIGDRWLGAEGHLTLFNGTPCRTRTCAGIRDAVAVMTAPGQFISAHERNVYDAFTGMVRVPAFGGDSYAYGLLASGFADVVLEANLKAHDIMAAVAIIKGAGGIITDWQGREPTLDNCTGATLACGDPRLHADLMRMIAAAPAS